MKEFTSQTGGRYTYIDDILNLQDLALSFAALFEGCGDFVLSGCQVSGKTISPGYVWLNGKLRRFVGTSSMDSYPAYIYEHNSVERVSYADSGDKIGRNVYGCAVASAVPLANDVLTGKPPRAIALSADGSVRRVKEALFGRYALLLDAPSDVQNINKNLNVGGKLRAEGGASVEQKMEIGRGTSKAYVGYLETGEFVVESKLPSKDAVSVRITTDGAVRFQSGDVVIASLDRSGVTLKTSVNAASLKGGNIVVSGNDIYNTGIAEDGGLLRINMLGYGGESRFFRDTVIGNGKNTPVLQVFGATGISQFSGAVVLKNPDAASLVLQHSTLSQVDASLLKSLVWRDKDGADMALMGYLSQSNRHWAIENKLGDILLKGTVRVSGNLYVGNLDIRAVLVSYVALSDTLNKKAFKSDVYHKTEADRRFAQKSELFRDIVSDGLSASAPGYSQTLANRKRTLCNNIGAVYVDDAALKWKDSGWIALEARYSKLYVRQIGHIVSIQGELHTPHSGRIFTLPNSIDPPSHKIGYSHNRGGEWQCVMDAGSRDCMVDRCNNGCAQKIGFLLTYIV